MKIRAAGLNAIQTYVPWNFHESTPGAYNFTGERDIVKFIKTAQECGLLVILRPGPYICAEWDMGGLPSWLLTIDNIALRTADKTYLTHVDRWLGVLFPKMKPLLYENGGPIITVQVENEYGSYYACDHDYMSHLESVFRRYLGGTVVLFTTDGDKDDSLKCGTLPSLYATVDFGTSDNVDKAFQSQRDFEPKGPLVNSEFYTGWLDHWGEPHSRVATQNVVDTLDKILSMNASVNMYMFEGGTNFGFWNGAELLGNIMYQPVPTSYDYDAPLSEAGDPTEKYTAIRELIKKYAPVTEPVPAATPKTAYGKVVMKQVGSLWNGLKSLQDQVADRPISFENLGQSFGFVIYSAEFNVTANYTWDLILCDLRDRASVFLDSNFLGTLFQQNRDSNVSISLPPGTTDVKLQIVVENMGRVNYGTYLNDSKGILGGVFVSNTTAGPPLSASNKWTSAPIPLDNPSEFIKFSSLADHEDPPLSVAFYSGEFAISGTVNDTYLNVDNWSKGVAIINGFNLGRYWPNKGPQKTLYVPASVLSSSEPNTLMLFEIDQAPCKPQSVDCFTTFVDKPDIG